MKVFINGRFLTQAVTGVQRYARCLLRALDRRLGDGQPTGLRFTVLRPPDATPSSGLRHLVERPVGRWRGHVWEQLDLPRHARGGLLLSLCNSAPLSHPRQIVTIHDASVFAVPHSYRAAFRHWYRFLHPRLGRRAAFVLTDSEFSGAELARLAGIPPAKLRVVPLGAEHVRDVPADHTILERMGLRRRIVLTVGSHSPHKNLGAFVQVAHRLREMNCDFVVAGGVNPRVFDAQHENLTEDVRVTGYVSDGALRALYEHAACFVYPSRYEGFGLPPLEAMACGCPVVSSNAASLPEVCGDAALYCAPDDPADIAERLAQLLRDPPLGRRLAELGRARARTFTWDRAAELLLAVLTAAEDLIPR